MDGSRAQTLEYGNRDGSMHKFDIAANGCGGKGHAEHVLGMGYRNMDMGVRGAYRSPVGVC
jgi:hypothetical protein